MKYSEFGRWTSDALPCSRAGENHAFEREKPGVFSVTLIFEKRTWERRKR